jgi:hypothetical protein
MRSRILDVLRFGTPICALPKQPFLEKQGRKWLIESFQY